MKKLLILVLTIAVVFSLCACGGTATTEASQLSEAGSDCFTVKCVDTDGAPVVGAKIQACTDTSCFMAVSDESGIAAFNVNPDKYEVHVYKAPEGYSADDAVINTTPDDIQIEIVFTAGSIDVSETAGTVETEYSSLEDINFSDYKLVMINYWEPWCDNCIAEMPDLETLYQNYKDDGLLIVGMYSYEEDAAEMIEMTEITYPVIKYEKGSVPIAAYPTTYFYDSFGDKIPANEDFITESYFELFSSEIDGYLNGDYDDANLSEDDIAWIESAAEKRDNGTLEDFAREFAKDDIASDAYAYVGSASYEQWESRMLDAMQ